MPETKETYPLADGLRVPLRALTFHAGDDAARPLLREIEELETAIDDSRKLRATLKTPKERAIVTAEIVEMRGQVDQLFPKFCREYLRADMGGNDVDAKVLSQCDDQDMTVLIRSARQGRNYLKMLADLFREQHERQVAELKAEQEVLRELLARLPANDNSTKTAGSSAASSTAASPATG